MTRIKTNLTPEELAKLFLEFARENKLESKIQANILNYKETFRGYDLPTVIYVYIYIILQTLIPE